MMPKFFKYFGVSTWIFFWLAAIQLVLMGVYLYFMIMDQTLPFFMDVILQISSGGIVINAICQLLNVWYFNKKAHKIELDLNYWFYHREEIDLWVKDNIRWIFLYKILGNNYSFMRETDAMAFKLKFVE